MKISRWRTLIIGFLCLIVGYGIGTATHSPKKEAQGPPPSERARQAEHPPTTPHGRLQPTSQEKQIADRRQETRYSSRIAGLKWLSLNTGVRPVLPVLGAGTELSPAFLDFFELTNEEKNALQDALNQASLNIETIERRSAVVAASPEHDKMIVTVPPYAEQGGVIYDSLVQTFSNVLGAERFADFNNYFARNFENNFNAFGASNASFDVSAITGSPGAESVVKMKKTLQLFSGSVESASIELKYSDFSKRFPMLDFFARKNLKIGVP